MSTVSSIRCKVVSFAGGGGDSGTSRHRAASTGPSLSSCQSDHIRISWPSEDRPSDREGTDCVVGHCIIAPPGVNHSPVIFKKWGADLSVPPLSQENVLARLNITAENPKWAITDYRTYRTGGLRTTPVKSLKITKHVMEKSLNFFGSPPSPSPKLQFAFYERKSKFFQIKVSIGFSFQHFFYRIYKSHNLKFTCKWTANFPCGPTDSMADHDITWRLVKLMTQYGFFFS